MTQINQTILDKVKKHVLGALASRNDISEHNVNVYVSAESFPIGECIRLGYDSEVTLDRESCVALIDHAPLKNWTHACEHFLYDAVTGEHYATHPAMLPPARFHHHPEKFLAVHQPVSHVVNNTTNVPSLSSLPKLDNVLANVVGEKYALLFSGMSNYRHLNDLEFLYRVLIDVYHFDPSKIIVLNYDGSVNYGGRPQPVASWPGDGTPYRISVNGPGTNTAFSQALDSLATLLQPEDLLLIHTNNHGGGPNADPEAWLCCYPNYTSFTATQFGNKIAALPKCCSLMVMMEQCHSGGFMDAVIQKSKANSTSFAAACEATAESYGYVEFDFFAVDWISAMAGARPDGAGLLGPVPRPASAADAFKYAKDVKCAGDSPVFADAPTGVGNAQYLTGCAQTVRFKSTTASCNSDGRLEVFAIEQGDSVWHVWQTAPNNGWSNFASMGGVVKQLVAGMNADGRLEVFAIGSDNAVWHNWQTVPHGGPWSGWQTMGGWVSQITLGRNKDGRLELFGIGRDKALWHIWQTAPSNGWSQWASLGGGVKEIKAGSNADGRQEVFAVGNDDALWHIWQTAPNNGWSKWSTLGGNVRGLEVANNADGRLEVFAVGSNQAMWHIWQTAPNNGWSAWASLGGNVRSLNAERNKDGRLEVFAIGSDLALWHIWQTAPNSGWSNWASLGGAITQISSDRNADGRIEVFAIGKNDSAVWHIWQTAPNNGWSGWARLS